MEHADSESRQTYVEFSVGNDHYAAPVQCVREVIQTGEIRPLPGVDESIRGLLNVRGQVISVVDLVVLFAKETSDASASYIILRRSRDEANSLLGIRVTSVLRVFEVESVEVRSLPASFTGVDRSYFSGVFDRDDQLVLIVDPNALFEHASSGTRVA